MSAEWLKKQARKLTEKPHCVDFCLMDGQVAPPEEEIEAAVADEQKQKKPLVEIKMRNLII